MKILLNRLKVSDISLIFCCFSLHFLIAIDMLIIVPFSASIALDTGTSSAQAGYLTAAYALSAAVISLIMKCRKNVNHEQKRILLLLAGVTITTLLVSVFNDFYLVLFTRLLTGIFGGALAVVNLNYLLLASNDSNKKKNTAILLSAFPLALALGVPLLLFSTSATNWQLGFQLLGGGFTCLLILFALYHHYQDSAGAESTASLAPALSTSEPPATHKALRFALLIITSAVVSTFIVSTQYPVMLITTLNIPDSLLSWCYTVSGIGSFLAIQAYARISLQNRSISYVITLLSIAMLVAIHLGFSTLEVVYAAITFIVFVIASSARTLIITTELISSLTVNDRVKMIGLQGAVQHFSVGLGSTISSTLITLGSDLSPDFTQVITVATALIMLTPILWWRNSGKETHSSDKPQSANSK
ncbi:MFS transporter [Photobacterium kagoshimensis]|uniref:MFS transporter n=1 Tax=Photobacterium kagoshimensis TaxID=2910242 RepID=UPI003D0A2FF3